MKLTIAGLGPGGANLLSVETMQALQNASTVILRTKLHPAVAALDKAGITYETCDAYYEDGKSFEEVYQKITEYVVAKARETDVLYAVPGSPLVAEKTVVMLRKAFSEDPSRLEILPSMSFLDLVYAKLHLDPINGLRIADASDTEALADAGRYPLVLTQVYSKFIAAELKINLMEVLSDETPVFFLHNLGLEDEVCRTIPLYELDRQEEIDHLTTVYIPKAAQVMDLNPLIDIVKVLREPGGCPWDRVQTHTSIRKGLVEETYELLEAIDNNDPTGMLEELGDILLQVVFHARIAEEDGFFTMQDVITVITDKLVYRHPHVFGTVEINDEETVIDRWEQLKALEKKDRTKVLDGVSPGLPSLMRAYKLQSKAAKVGFDWPNLEGVLDKVVEEVNEIKEASLLKDQESIEWEIGDLLFALVNYIRHLELEPETALNRANNRFRQRFNYIEEKVQLSGKKWQDFSVEELEKWWQDAKKCDKLVKK